MTATNAAAEYQAFRAFLAKACGILLGDNKQYLVASRLKKLMAEAQIDSLAVLVTRLQQTSNRRLKEAVVDAMTTNETLWFRDTHPFTVLKERLLPELKDNRGPIKVWSAACSSGQEPYSISMMADEFVKANPGSLRQGLNISATDLSSPMLECCRQAAAEEPEQWLIVAADVSCHPALIEPLALALRTLGDLLPAKASAILVHEKREAAVDEALLVALDKAGLVSERCTENVPDQLQLMYMTLKE